MTNRITLALSLALAAVTADLAPAQSGQTPPCLGANFATTTATTARTQFSFSGETHSAWRFTPPSPRTIQAVQIFTENSQISGDRSMSIEFWSDSNNLPDQRITGGAWKIRSGRPAAWQGANLERPAMLQSGVPMWLVWVDPGYSQHMSEPGGTLMLPSASRIGSGAWTGGAPQAPKFKLFCNLLDDINSVPYGTGCPLTTGTTPTIFTNEPPTIGNLDFFLETCGNPPGAPVFVVFGGTPGFVSLPVPGFPAGCMQNTDIIASLLLFAGTGNTQDPTYAGHALVQFPFPNDPGLAGVFFAAQAAALDSGSSAPIPFSTSNAHRITLF